MADTTDDQLFEPELSEGQVREKVPAGSAKVFRAYDVDQLFLLPPSIDDWLPEAHEARFVSEVIEEMLDLSAIYASYEEAPGAPPYDPRMMLKLLVYAYATGVTSSREMERRCSTDVAFRFLSANAAPDYRSISRFRRRHLEALEDLFVQVLALCAQAGLVNLGKVALDGTKLRASASRHKAMSYDRIVPRIEELETEVAELLRQAEEADCDEDDAYGKDRRGDEIPEELARRETRLAKLRAAKEQIEAEARDKAARIAEKAASRRGDEHPAAAAREKAEKAKPDGRAQRSFTDPESRMMKTNDGFQYAYNAQAVVDEGAQVILAADVTDEASDAAQLTKMMEAVSDNLEDAGIDDAPDTLLADAGYCSEENLEAVEDDETDVIIATGRIRRNGKVPSPRGPVPKGATRREQMARRLRTKPGRAAYARRKAIVEPAFGQMKVRQRAGYLRLRGIEGARGEWQLHAICHNLRKLRSAC